ncbi:MAG: hypothetical protein ACRC62_28835 [Microcoleus sp.]
MMKFIRLDLRLQVESLELIVDTVLDARNTILCHYERKRSISPNPERAASPTDGYAPTQRAILRGECIQNYDN